MCDRAQQSPGCVLGVRSAAEGFVKALEVLQGVDLIVVFDCVSVEPFNIPKEAGCGRAHL